MLQTAPPDLSYVCPDVRFREIGCIPIIGMKCAAELMETPWVSRDVSALDELAALLTPQRIRHGMGRAWSRSSIRNDGGTSGRNRDWAIISLVSTQLNFISGRVTRPSSTSRIDCLFHLDHASRHTSTTYGSVRQERCKPFIKITTTTTSRTIITSFSCLGGNMLQSATHGIPSRSRTAPQCEGTIAMPRRRTPMSGNACRRYVMQSSVHATSCISLPVTGITSNPSQLAFRCRVGGSITTWQRSFTALGKSVGSVLQSLWRILGHSWLTLKSLAALLL